MLALQSPIEYQKEQSQTQGAASTLRKTNSQPASMMQSTLSQPLAHSQYTRMVSLPQSRTAAATASVSATRSNAVKGQKTADKVRGGQEAAKGRSSAGSPQPGRRTIFAGLRSSLSRLSKSPSHEDLRRETTDTATAGDVDEQDDDGDDNEDDVDDDDSKVKVIGETGSGENVATEAADTSESDCRQQQRAVRHDAIPAPASDSATL